MIRTIIVEDEKPAMDRLKSLLKNIEEIELIGTSFTGKEAVQMIDQQKPDLVFLDIHLADISGIDVLRLTEHKPMIIFTTAYNQYAIEAFDLQAVDYLLKPFSSERLEESVRRAREKMNTRPYMNFDLNQLLSRWSPQHDHLKRIPSKIGDKIYIINDDQVVYFNTEEKLVFAHLADTKYLVNYRMEELQARLDPEKFFRIHRSTIVNLNYVHTIEAWFAGGYLMKVHDKYKTELTISRAAGKALRQKLGW
jgi:DNA-binding LytR/AlgR family response regulator